MAITAFVPVSDVARMAAILPATPLVVRKDLSAVPAPDLFAAPSVDLLRVLLPVLTPAICRAELPLPVPRRIDDLLTALRTHRVVRHDRLRAPADV